MPKYEFQLIRFAKWIPDIKSESSFFSSETQSSKRFFCFIYLQITDQPANDSNNNNEKKKVTIRENTTLFDSKNEGWNAPPKQKTKQTIRWNEKELNGKELVRAEQLFWVLLYHTTLYAYIYRRKRTRYKRFFSSVCCSGAIHVYDMWWASTGHLNMRVHRAEQQSERRALMKGTSYKAFIWVQ